ncbi:MAG: CBS domain-containing protein [Candidatus Roizmanbacteria bacterium]|nr:CBS domain-containing protein [Candidatus Roizmanbacteria bacterium]
MTERSLKDLFHLVKEVLPETQELVIFSSEMPVKEALEVMRKKNISQVPIVEGDEVLGVFSYRSLAEGMRKLAANHKDVLSLPVLEFCEDLKFAQITDELKSLLDEFDLKDAVLVGTQKRLQGIVTVVDALRYFYRVAAPYILVREIELAIRELMRASVDADGLKECTEKALQGHYQDKNLPIPTYLEEMTITDCVNILRFKGTWEKFAPAFGENANIVYTKLKPLPDLRNDIFHFRRELTLEEYDRLRDIRDWLLKRITKLEAKKRIRCNG